MHRIYRAYEVLLKMLDARNTPTLAKVDSLEELEKVTGGDINKALEFFSGTYQTDVEPIMVVWTEILNAEVVQNVYAGCEKLMKKKKVKHPHAIIIWNEKQTAPSNTVIEKSVIAGGLNLETFGVSQLQFYLLDNKWAFPCRKLSKKETRELLEVYMTRLDKLPGLLKEDPMAKFYNFQVGDVIEITRPNKTIGSHALSWRVVRRKDDE